MNIMWSLIMIALIGVSCKRRPLTYEEQHEYAELTIEVNWTEAFEPEDKPTGVSVWLYPQEGGLPIQTYSANVDSHKVLVEVGKYDVVVFNLTPFELSSTIGFRGEESLNTLEVYSKAITSTREPNASRGVLTHEPEPFAVVVHRDLEVTKAMVEDTRLSKLGELSKASVDRVVRVTPKLANHRHGVRVQIEGYKNLAMGGVFAELSGLAEGFYVGSGRVNSTNARQALSSWVQMPTSSDNSSGEASVQYTTWGLTASDDVAVGDYSKWTGLLELLMKLVDGSTKSFNINLDKDNIRDQTTGVVTNIELLIEVGFNSGEEIVLPDVEPTDDPTGFDPEVSPWDEEVDVPVVVG